MIKSLQVNVINGEAAEVKPLEPGLQVTGA